MQLKIDRVIPIPLKEKITAHESGFWNKTFSWTKGESIFIQAPSGTGKTTLIHLLYNLRTDFEGTIAWNDKNLLQISEEDLSELRSKNVSVIFQDLRLFPSLTAWENLMIKQSLTNTVDEKTMTGWMERLGIAHKKNSLAGTLSYGEQQRVAILRALLQPFEWLLMDEPFSHLDNANIYKAATLVQEVALQRNAGMILADLEDNNYFNYTRKILL